MEIGPENVTRNSGDRLDLDDVLGRNTSPFQDRRTSEPEAVSHLGWQATPCADQRHTLVQHKRCLPQESTVGKSNCSPTDSAGRAMIYAMDDVGDRIRRARLSVGMSQRRFAEALGVSHGLVGAWETQAKLPGRDVLLRIAQITATDAAELLTGKTAPARVTDPRDLLFLRLFRRLSRRQQDNLLELLGVAGDVRRQIERESEPSE